MRPSPILRSPHGGRAWPHGGTHSCCSRMNLRLLSSDTLCPKTLLMKGMSRTIRCTFLARGTAVYGIVKMNQRNRSELCEQLGGGDGGGGGSGDGGDGLTGRGQGWRRSGDFGGTVAVGVAPGKLEGLTGGVGAGGGGGG